MVQHPSGGQFFAPTVLVDVTTDMRIWRSASLNANAYAYAYAYATDLTPCCVNCFECAAMHLLPHSGSQKIEPFVYCLGLIFAYCIEPRFVHFFLSQTSLKLKLTLIIHLTLTFIITLMQAC